MSLNITSYDPDQLKQSLIEFYQNRPGFEDFNYEGSALLTIIDNLVRNTHYIAYMANMTATESFLDSAQLRSNIVSHAQKLSYTPKSRTAATIVVNLAVTADSNDVENSIVCNKNSSFINTVNGVAYSFINTSDITLVKGSDNVYRAIGVDLKQGLLNTQRFLYTGQKIEIQNTNIDTSTLKVYVKQSQTDTNRIEYAKVDNITIIDSETAAFYLSENTRGFYDIEFGKGVLGIEPPVNSVVEIEYVVVEEEHANGLASLIAATSISGYSNITVTVATPAYGGAERASLESIKFLAPRLYETQERAVKEEDYSSLVLRDFPFIKSAIAWGGERNSPPFYGRVFIALIPQDGFVVADSVKSVIQQKMKEYSLLTTDIVDVYYIQSDLVISVLYNASKTTKTFDQIKSDVIDTVQQYNSNIKEFDKWLNNTELERLIVEKVPPIYSVEIAKNLYTEIEPRSFATSSYIVQFVNRIQPKSVNVEGVFVSLNGNVQTLKDDGQGNMVLTVDAVSTIVGAVDYETGELNFIITQLNSDLIKVSCLPVFENVYTTRNFVVNIGQVTVEKIVQ